MALEAGRGHQVRRMAIIAGGTLVVDATAFSARIGMREVELGGNPG